MQICCVLIKVYPMSHGESFHPSLLLFLFDWQTKRWKIAEEVPMICMAYTYYIMLMAKYMCTWLHHSLNYYQACFCPVPFQVSQNGFMLRLIWLHVLGLWFASTAAAAKIAIRQAQWWIGRSFSSCTNSPHFTSLITNCKICNILCLNK